MRTTLLARQNLYRAVGAGLLVIGAIILTQFIISLNVRAASKLTDTVPENSDMSAGNAVHLVVARMGRNNALDSPYAFVKLYYNQPTGNKVRIHHYWHCDPTVFGAGDSNWLAKTKYRIYKLKADETLGAGNELIEPVVNTITNSGTCAAKDYTILGDLNESSEPGHEGKYVAILQVRHTSGPSAATSGDMDNGGGVNAFKVEAVDGKAGYVGFTDETKQEPEWNYKFFNGGTEFLEMNQDGDNHAVNAPYFSLQDRTSSSSSYSNLSVKFALPCTIKDETKNIYLKWADDDQGSTEQGDPLRWELLAYDRETGERRPADDQPAGGPFTPPNSPIDNQNRNKQVTVRRDRKYEWKWSHVQKTNGVQLWVPYDSFEHDVKCPDDPRISYNKVEIDASGTISNLPNTPELGGARVRIREMPITASSFANTRTAEAFEWKDLKKDTEYQLTVHDDPPLDWSLIGATRCRKAEIEAQTGPNKEAKCHKQKRSENKWIKSSAAGLKTPEPPGPGERVVVNTPGANDWYADVWFYYHKGGSRRIDIKKFEHKPDHSHQLLSDSSSPGDAVVSLYRLHSSGPDELVGRSTDSHVTNKANFSFFKLSPGTYQVVLEDNNSAEFPPAPPWKYAGRRLCDPNVSNCTSGPHGPGDVITIKVPAITGWFRELQFHWEKETCPAGSTDPLCIPKPAEHKIFGANVVDILQGAVRDNFNFDTSLRSYVWPNAGVRTTATDRTKRLWLAGEWGRSAADGSHNVQNQTSQKADLNQLNTFNLKAETGCPASSACAQRVPLAYVPADDGTNVTPPDKDGSKTPNGNNWHRIREEQFHAGYSTQLGGIASTQTGPSYLNYNLGDPAMPLRSGNLIHDVEVSNIHVKAIGITPATKDNNLQGKLTSANVLQQPDRALNLPGGSQGPDKDGPIWDNMRNPNAFPGTYSANQVAHDLSFPNSGGSPSNLSNIESMLSHYSGRSLEYFKVKGVTLLQDGNDLSDPPYQNKTEPFSYTATVDKLNNSELRWDEHVIWSQIDDKGHHYTTRGTRAIGVDKRHVNSGEQWTRRTVGSYNSGHAVYVNHEHCSNILDADGEVIGQNCHNHPHLVNSQETSCVGPTSISYNTNTLGYYRGGYQSQWGWRNTGDDLTFNNAPYGSHGSTSPSSFYLGAYPVNGTPTWSQSQGKAFHPYWQDTNVTAMSQAGSTNKRFYTERWERNFSDPVYTNRYIFNNFHTPFFYTGYNTYGSSCVTHWDNGGITSVNENNLTISNYYPSPSHMHESTPSAVSPADDSKWNVAYDGNKFDNVVDVGWAWKQNWQRVRYENTYPGHSRRLGPRCRAVDGNNCKKENDNLLYGLDELRSIQAGRDSALITNPTVDIGSGEVFAGGAIDSYFQNSSAGSAFLFTNTGTIKNYSGGAGRYFNYFLNPNQQRVTSDYSQGGSLDPIHNVFGASEYAALKSRDATGGSPQFGTPTSNKSGHLWGGSEGRPINQEGQVYVVHGNLTLGSVTNFCNGAATVIVEGDMIIEGNLGYCGGSVTNKKQVASLGFIVEGNVIVRPNVTQIVGSYFVRGQFRSGSYTLGLDGYSPNDNRTANDPSLNVRGLVVARSFNLGRQLSGTANLTNPAERFIYDGRIVVNPPPGFAKLYSAPSEWTERVPLNRAP